MNLNGKVNVSLCLINYASSNEDVMGSGGIAPSFSIAVLDRDDWSASRPGCFVSGEIAPGTHCIGGWVGPRAGLDAVE
jgi:hypothetical protein